MRYVKILDNSASVGGRLRVGDVVEVLRETDNYICVKEVSQVGEDKVRKSSEDVTWEYTSRL